MADRPIIFSGPMVRALLAGRKTQTRRLATSPLRRVEVGDRLYVREAWAANEGSEGGIIHRAEYVGAAAISVWDLKIGGSPVRHVSRWRPSIHMPRWASRLTLIVEGVRGEPLQAITLDDLRAEGVHQRPGSNLWWATEEAASFEPDSCFGALWNGLHTREGETWTDNPNVVALTFRVERANIDTLPTQAASAGEGR